MFINVKVPSYSLLFLPYSAPVIFQYEPKPEDNDTIYLYTPDYEGKFNLTYIISGSNLEKPQLFRNSTSEDLLNKETYFTYEEEHIKGNFNYSQDKALQIMLGWDRDKIPETDGICSKLTYFDGEYTLQALGTAAEKPSVANTTFMIETQCKEIQIHYYFHAQK